MVSPFGCGGVHVTVLRSQPSTGFMQQPFQASGKCPKKQFRLPKTERTGTFTLWFYVLQLHEQEGSVHEISVECCEIATQTEQDVLWSFLDSRRPGLRHSGCG